MLAHRKAWGAVRFLYGAFPGVPASQPKYQTLHHVKNVYRPVVDDCMICHWDSEWSI
jgi:hypothetical protein